MRLANKVAVITGGGSGLGQASAYLFAREGAKVVVAQRTVSTGEETADTIKSGGGEAIYVRTDVTIASDVEHLIRVTVDTFGKIDILFNNAGMGQDHIEVDALSEELWDYLYAVNVKGTFLPTKYAVPEMKKTAGGSIINTASMSAIRPRMWLSAYSSSKGAVIVLTKALALELARYNIRVNAINPVTTETPLVRREADKTGGWEKFKEERAATIPLGRLGKPEDTAYAALYLASDESSMLTGTCIDVDGGRGI